MIRTGTIIDAHDNAAGGLTVEAWTWPPAARHPTRTRLDLDTRHNVLVGDEIGWGGDSADDYAEWYPAGGFLDCRKTTVRLLGRPYGAPAL